MSIRNSMIRAFAAVSVLASSLLLTQAGQANAATNPAASIQAASDVANCALIDFDRASVTADATTNALRRVLVVSGVSPTAGVKVTLVPLTYVRQPDYWGIEVISCSPKIGLPGTTPYTAKLDITSTVGTIGVEVIGAKKSQKIPLFFSPGPALAS